MLLAFLLLHLLTQGYKGDVGLLTFLVRLRFIQKVKRTAWFMVDLAWILILVN